MAREWDICIALGARIRLLREERGWRQIDLAEESKISENYVSDLELGNKEVCLRMLHRVAQAFEMSISDLLKGID